MFKLLYSFIHSSHPITVDSYLSISMWNIKIIPSLSTVPPKPPLPSRIPSTTVNHLRLPSTHTLDRQNSSWSCEHTKKIDKMVSGTCSVQFPIKQNHNPIRSVPFSPPKNCMLSNNSHRNECIIPKMPNQKQTKQCYLCRPDGPL